MRSRDNLWLASAAKKQEIFTAAVVLLEVVVWLMVVSSGISIYRLGGGECESRADAKVVGRMTVVHG